MGAPGPGPALTGSCTPSPPFSECHACAGKAQGISVQNNNTYEQEFALEMEKARQGKVKNTPWGSSFRAAPEILHGEKGRACVRACVCVCGLCTHRQ